MDFAALAKLGIIIVVLACGCLEQDESPSTQAISVSQRPCQTNSDCEVYNEVENKIFVCIGNECTEELSHESVSEYCLKNGGKEVVTGDITGGQKTVCQFSDGKECDLWEFYSGKCKKDK